MNELASLGLILLFALFAGHIVKFLHVPEVTGYIGAGILVGPTCSAGLPMTIWIRSRSSAKSRWV